MSGQHGVIAPLLVVEPQFRIGWVKSHWIIKWYKLFHVICKESFTDVLLKRKADEKFPGCKVTFGLVGADCCSEEIVDSKTRPCSDIWNCRKFAFFFAIILVIFKQNVQPRFHMTGYVSIITKLPPCKATSLFAMITKMKSLTAPIF